MQTVRFWFSKRFLVGILAFFGEMNVFSLRANVNMAILDMTTARHVTEGNTTIIYNPEFNWDSQTRGFVLSSHAYGSLLAVLGGYLALRFGGSMVIATCSFIASILTILNPLAVRFNFYLFIVFRIIEGACEEFKFISFTELWTQWSPKRDRSKLMALTMSGMYAGPAIIYPICGFLIQRHGWPTAFHFTGGFSLLWTIIWFILVPNSPTSDKWISKEELDYIQQDPQQSRPTNLISVWKNMFLSKPLYAVGFAKLVYCFGTTIVVTCLPMYIADLTHTRIDEVGVYSAIPNVINIFMVPIIGYIIDYLQNVNMSTSRVHKSFLSGAIIFGGIALLAVTYLCPNLILLMVYLTLFTLTVSVNNVVSNLNVIALAPKCASIVASFLAFAHMFGSIIAPITIGFIVTNHSLSQWNICFVTFAIISFCGALIFLRYGSGEPQPWAYLVETYDSQKCDSSK